LYERVNRSMSPVAVFGNLLPVRHASRDDVIAADYPQCISQKVRHVGQMGVFLLQLLQHH